MTMLHVDSFLVPYMVKQLFSIIVFLQIQFRIGGGLKGCSLKISLMVKP